MVTTNKWSQPVYTENDLCELLLRDPDRSLDGAAVARPIIFDRSLQISSIPQLDVLKQLDGDLSVDDWDRLNQDQWWMPDQYRTMDIALWVIDQCPQNEEALQRVAEELLLYQRYEMFDILRYLKYLVDTMRAHGIVWGVGRGSSVASYVLFLLGVHKIDSIYWDIPISEFLRD